MPQSRPKPAPLALTLLRSAMPKGVQEFPVCINSVPQTILIMAIDDWRQLPEPRPKGVLSNTGDMVLLLMASEISSPGHSREYPLLCP